MKFKRFYSIKEFTENVDNQEEYSYGLRDFLDGFYPASIEEKRKKLAEPPAALPFNPHFNFVYLCAVAEHLSMQYQIPAPKWTYGQRLKDPYFAAKSQGLRMCFLFESPSAFRGRNIFVSENVLSRA